MARGRVIPSVCFSTMPGHNRVMVCAIHVIILRAVVLIQRHFLFEIAIWTICHTPVCSILSGYSRLCLATPGRVECTGCPSMLNGLYRALTKDFTKKEPDSHGKENQSSRSLYCLEIGEGSLYTVFSRSAHVIISAGVFMTTGFPHHNAYLGRLFVAQGGDIDHW